jgi:hypothetical protein
MILRVQLIQRPEVDFAALLSLGQTALGRSLARKVDASPIECSDTERYLACLADLRPVDGDQLLMHAAATLLVVGHDLDLVEVVQASGLACLLADTKVRGVQLGIFTGSLLAWKECLTRSAKQTVSPVMREFAEKCRIALVAGGMDVFGHLEITPLDTLLLE